MKFPAAAILSLFILAGFTGKIAAQDNASPTKALFPVGQFDAQLNAPGLMAGYFPKDAKMRFGVPLVLTIDSSGKLSSKVVYELPSDMSGLPGSPHPHHYRIRFELNGQIDPLSGRTEIKITNAINESGNDATGHRKWEFDENLFGWYVPGPKSEQVKAWLDKGLSRTKDESLRELGKSLWSGPMIVGLQELNPGTVVIKKRTRHADVLWPKPLWREDTYRDLTTDTQAQDSNVAQGSFSLFIHAPVPESKAAGTPASPAKTPIPESVSQEPASRISLDDALKMSVRLIPPDPKADLDGDGEITAADARLIREAEVNNER